MSLYSKKDVQDPLLFEGGVEAPPAGDVKAPADDGILTR
jgi:hypothetical protein